MANFESFESFLVVRVEWIWFLRPWRGARYTVVEIRSDSLEGA